MRESKFRAWDKQEKKMCEVQVLGFPQREQAYASLMPYEGPYITCHFDEIELMQFTGLTDKRRKKVYEGDIVIASFYHYSYDGQKTVENKVRQVMYDEEMLLLPFHEDWGGNLWMHGVVDGFEVVGNIYETPELLKGAGYE